MKETNENTIANHLESQRAFFAMNQTKDVQFRLEQLGKLKKVVVEYEERIQEAENTLLLQSLQTMLE